MTSCFYLHSNIDRVKQEAAWSEDLERWRLPDLVVSRTKFPPAVPLDNAFMRHHLVEPTTNGLSNGTGASNSSSNKSSANGSTSPDNSDHASSPGSDEGNAIILQVELWSS